MQTTQYIVHAQLDRVIDSVFEDGTPIVKEAYSEFDSPTREFPSADDLREDMTYTPGQEKAFFYYALYYPETAGPVFEKRIDLKPGACKGHTHRYCQEGWGLIFLQVSFRNYPKVECCVTVNSDKRAANWSGVYPELKSPELWDWAAVNRHAGRLVRLLRRLGKGS